MEIREEVHNGIVLYFVSNITQGCYQIKYYNKPKGDKLLIDARFYSCLPEHQEITLLSHKITLYPTISVKKDELCLITLKFLFNNQLMDYRWEFWKVTPLPEIELE